MELCCLRVARVFLSGSVSGCCTAVRVYIELLKLVLLLLYTWYHFNVIWLGCRPVKGLPRILMWNFTPHARAI